MLLSDIQGDLINGTIASSSCNGRTGLRALTFGTNNVAVLEQTLGYSAWTIAMWFRVNDGNSTLIGTAVPSGGTGADYSAISDFPNAERFGLGCLL